MASTTRPCPGSRTFSLTDRRQRVIVNGQSSRWHTVTSGIPQGSVLGPVLCVVYINTMVENDTVSDIYLYADDTKVFKEVNTISDSQSLQQDINSLYTWTQDSLLRFHPEKCVEMRVGNSPDEVPVTYTMGGVPLTISNEEKDLGVLIDSKLNFDRHIGVKVNKANIPQLDLYEDHLNILTHMISSNYSSPLSAHI